MKPNGEAARVGKFGIVGVINFSIDFALYNLLLAHFVGSKEIAKVLSSTVAMVFSFFANKNAVFQDKSKRLAPQALKFFGLTAFNLYVIQVSIIHFLSERWTGLTTLANAVATTIHLNGLFTPDFMQKNVPFVAGVAVGLVWNYIMYKKVVFKR